MWDQIRSKGPTFQRILYVIYYFVLLLLLIRLRPVGLESLEQVSQQSFHFLSILLVFY